LLACCFLPLLDLGGAAPDQKVTSRQVKSDNLVRTFKKTILQIW